MKTQITTGLLLLFISACRETQCQRTTGKLFLLGGATSDSSDSIYNQLRLATNKEVPKIAVVISAAPNLNVGLDAYYIDDNGLSYQNLFIRYGFEPTVLNLAINELANSNETENGRENIEKIQDADV